MKGKKHTSGRFPHFTFLPYWGRKTVFLQLQQPSSNYEATRGKKSIDCGPWRRKVKKKLVTWRYLHCPKNTGIICLQTFWHLHRYAVSLSHPTVFIIICHSPNSNLMPALGDDLCRTLHYFLSSDPFRSSVFEVQAFMLPLKKIKSNTIF